jgi:cob(I)alamin adenosyltransferase
MRITKVYTRTGDKGTTRLAGGQKVPKDHLRLEGYGTIDELNSVVGLARSFTKDLFRKVKQTRRLDDELLQIQNKLFDIGGILATSPGQTFKNMPAIKKSDTLHLENLMDECQKDLKPLKEFILPGGGKIAGFLHQARTVCRRAERICVRLNHEEKVPADVLKYLNRLSDTLFVLARWISKAQKEHEILWNRSKTFQ